MKLLVAAIIYAGFWLAGSLAIAQVGPLWLRVIGGACVMFILIVAVQQLADLQKKVNKPIELGVSFEDRPTPDDHEVESRWHH